MGDCFDQPVFIYSDKEMADAYAALKNSQPPHPHFGKEYCKVFEYEVVDGSE
jgi:hypothetical protein